MTRTRCGAFASPKVKVNLPAASVFACPTSSMPAASLMRMASSPADGLLAVPLVTVPLRVAANRDDALARSRDNKTTRSTIGGQPSSAVLRAELERLQVLRPGLRSTDSQW